MSAGYDKAATERRRRVLEVVVAIPHGQVLSYGAVARRAGMPKAARFVARVLGDNDDARVPWHRVVRSDLRIAFAPGSPPWREQCDRLRREGVEIRGGRVRLPLDRDLDRLVWGGP